MNQPKPRLAMVSIGIRRDLLAPLKYFTRFNLIHLYRASVYDDLTPQDLDESLTRYNSPLALYRKLVAARPDVIQGVEPFSYFTQPFLWACYLGARKTRAALFVAAHENRPLDIKFGSARARLLQRMLRPYFARACLIIAHNNGARENVLVCGGAPDKLVRGMWGNWGVDTNEFFPRACRAPEQAPTILFVGRLHVEKGVFVLLAAFAVVREHVSNARLIFVGDGPARAELVSRIQTRASSDCVELRGTIKHRDLPDIFRQADVFCAPSLTTKKWAEQVGASALQAMACGLPIVSTQSGAIPEYVPGGVAGLLVPENDARALANALIQFLVNRQLAQQYGTRGRAFAETHYAARTNVARGEQLVMEHCLARSV